jgi:hypothetical protein
MGTWRTYWEHHEKSLQTLWELDENILFTLWELIVNLLRTHWEQEENEKSLLHLHSLQTQKIHWGHVEPSHWLHAIFISKIVVHIFRHRVTAPAKETMGYPDTGTHIGGYSLWFAIIRWGCLQCSKFLFSNESIWLAWHTNQTIEPMDALPITGLYYQTCCPSPLAQPYRWKEDNTCQSIWD